MATANKFIEDSLLCQWGYIANLDSHELDIYRGSQTTPPHESSRYQESANRMGYYPCRMVQTYLLDQLPIPESFLKDSKTWK